MTECGRRDVDGVLSAALAVVAFSVTVPSP